MRRVPGTRDRYMRHSVLGNGRYTGTFSRDFYHYYPHLVEASAKLFNSKPGEYEGSQNLYEIENK